MSISSNNRLSQQIPNDVRLGIRSTFGATVVAPGDGGTADATYTVCVGQMGQHVAQSNVPILWVQWVLNAPSVAGYTVTANAGTVFPVTAGMLIANPLTFAFTAAGTYTVGVYITTPYGTAYVSNTFVVTAPQVNFLDSATANVYVGPFAGGTYLRFGDSQNPAAPGITINAVIYGQQNLQGWVAYLQIATNLRVGTDTDNRPWHWNLNRQGVLDVGPNGAYVFYQNAVDVLNPGGNAQIDITDAPALELGPPFQLVSVGDGDPVVPESYSAYLMFCPNDPGAIWVPLSGLTWWWSGYSELTAGVWGPAQDAANSVNPLGAATNTFPQWTTNTNAGYWVQGL